MVSESLLSDLQKTTEVLRRSQTTKENGVETTKTKTTTTSTYSSNRKKNYGDEDIEPDYQEQNIRSSSSVGYASPSPRGGGDGR